MTLTEIIKEKCREAKIQEPEQRELRRREINYQANQLMQSIIEGQRITYEIIKNRNYTL